MRRNSDSGRLKSGGYFTGLRERMARVFFERIAVSCGHVEYSRGEAHELRRELNRALNKIVA